jgi:hypothetical protein
MSDWPANNLSDRMRDALDELEKEPGRPRLRASWWATVSPPGSDTPWVQVRLSYGALINFWYPYGDRDPLMRLREAGIEVPLDAMVLSIVPEKYCTVTTPYNADSVCSLVVEIFAKLYGYGDRTTLSLKITKSKPQAPIPGPDPVLPLPRVESQEARPAPGLGEIVPHSRTPRPELEIVPGERIGPVRLGMTRAEVLDLPFNTLGDDDSSVVSLTFAGEASSDYPDINVRFESERCARVELILGFSDHPSSATLDGVLLARLPQEDLEEVFERFGPTRKAYAELSVPTAGIRALKWEASDTAYFSVEIFRSEAR